MRQFSVPGYPCRATADRTELFENCSYFFSFLNDHLTKNRLFLSFWGKLRNQRVRHYCGGGGGRPSKWGRQIMETYRCWLSPHVRGFLGRFDKSFPARALFFFSCLKVKWRSARSHQSTRAHLHVMGMLRFMSWHTPTELARSFLFCSCVYVCLYGPFNGILFHKFSRQLSFSHSVLPVLFLPYWSYISLFMKVSFSPDIIPCGWLGSKHQLANW